MYIEASGKPIGYHARLESPILQSFGGSESVSKCLSFYFNMFGADMGQMNVYLVFIDGLKELLWKRSGNQDKAWHHGILTFTPFSTFKVGITYIQENDFLGVKKLFSYVNRHLYSTYEVRELFIHDMCFHSTCN